MNVIQIMNSIHKTMDELSIGVFSVCDSAWFGGVSVSFGGGVVVTFMVSG